MNGKAKTILWSCVLVATGAFVWAQAQGGDVTIDGQVALHGENAGIDETNPITPTEGTLPYPDDMDPIAYPTNFAPGTTGPSGPNWTSGNITLSTNGETYNYSSITVPESDPATTITVPADTEVTVHVTGNVNMDHVNITLGNNAKLVFMVDGTVNMNQCESNKVVTVWAAGNVDVTTQEFNGVAFANGTLTIDGVESQQGLGAMTMDEASMGEGLHNMYEGVEMMPIIGG